jgi:hypothetical protein
LIRVAAARLLGCRSLIPAQPDPDALFDRAWALALIEGGLLKVEMSCEKSGKAEQFDVLKRWLMGDSTDLSAASADAQLDLSSNAVTVAIHQLCKSFRIVIQ